MASVIRSDLFRNFVGGFVVGLLGIVLFVPEAHAHLATVIERIIV
jgi:hypothetical protein